MQITGQNIHCFNMKRKLKQNETIKDVLNIDDIKKIISSVTFYYRPPRDCPLSRGNWILDLELLDGNIICYKFPKELSEDEFKSFLAPLLEVFKYGMKREINGVWGEI